MNVNDPLNDPTSGEAKTSLTFTDEPSKQNWTMRDSGPLLSIPNNSISFHANSSKVIMRITPEGRLEKGEGLSDDEVSVQLFEICKNTFGGKMKELEEQLAAERARGKELVKGIKSILPKPPYHPDLEPEWVYLNELVNKGEAAP